METQSRSRPRRQLQARQVRSFASRSEETGSFQGALASNRLSGTKRKSGSADLYDLRETLSKFPRIQRPVFYSDGEQLLRDERGQGPPDNEEKQTATIVRNPCAKEVEIVYSSESAHRPLCV